MTFIVRESAVMSLWCPAGESRGCEQSHGCWTELRPRESRPGPQCRQRHAVRRPPGLGFQAGEPRREGPAGGSPAATASSVGQRWSRDFSRCESSLAAISKWATGSAVLSELFSIAVVRITVARLLTAMKFTLCFVIEILSHRRRYSLLHY